MWELNKNKPKNTHIVMGYDFLLQRDLDLLTETNGIQRSRFEHELSLIRDFSPLSVPSTFFYPPFWWLMIAPSDFLAQNGFLKQASSSHPFLRKQQYGTRVGFDPRVRVISVCCCPSQDVLGN